MRPPWRHFCEPCWKQIPGWLRRRIAQERESCRAGRTLHTQELLRLRDLAVAELAKAKTKNVA
jgi:hypothetical protein